MSRIEPIVDDRHGRSWLTQVGYSEGPEYEELPWILAMRIEPIQEVLEQITEEVPQ